MIAAAPSHAGRSAAPLPPSMERARTLERSFGALWRPLDPQLAGAAWAGEHLIARVRFWLLAALGSIPLLQLALGNREARVGLTCIALALAPATLVLLAVRRGIGQRWLGFASSLLDVTIVSAELVFFLFLGYPHLVVNSRVVYLIYFVIVGATALRYDARICVVTGLAAVVEYGLVVVWAVHRGFAGAAPDDALRYGLFEWDDQFARLVVLLAATAIAAATVRRSRELLRLSTRDRLTGLLNRGAFDQRLREELQRSRRRRTTLAVALLDLDNFKRINDTWGHLAGDEALRAVGAVLQVAVRIEDVVSRYGGEEFAIVFPDLGEQHALPRLEALRQRVAATAALPELAVSVTTSIGLAVAPRDGTTVEELLSSADDRLYRAKARGKDNVVGPEPGPGPEASTVQPAWA